MMRGSTLLLVVIAVAPLAACSDRSSPQSQLESPAPETPLPAPSRLDVPPGALRAKLTGTGVATEYVAHFNGTQLTRIVEQRNAASGASLHGEYTFTGARLLRYQGTKLDEPTALDLQFDMQGRLQAGLAPNVDSEEIDTIRNRAQLLRSHALAQQATKLHH